MKIGEFILQTLAVAIGVLIALAIAGVYAKAQLAAATSGSTTLGTILSLFGAGPATAAA